MFLEKYYLSALPFRDVSFGRWMNTEDFILFCRNQSPDPAANPVISPIVSPVVRLTLLSDGSLVRFLSALYLDEISVQVVGQRHGIMAADMAKYLDSAEAVDNTTRDAWLCCNNQRVVYAHSVIDSLNIERVIQKEINSKSKPFGILLGEYDIPIIKDQVFIAQLKSDDLAGQFSANDNLFWARCYRLRGGEEFNAAIFEVFSPDILISGK